MLRINVQSATELMSIALFAEREAVRRYTGLAANMHEHGNTAAASLFERMIREEREHQRLIEEWAKVEDVRLRTDVGPIVWEDPQVSTVYDDEARDPARSSAYRALAFAVHNEERAFRFYTHVAANAQDDTVREYAEILAREELGHAALLRALRRRAWHAERKAGRNEPELDPGSVQSLADLLAVAASIEHSLGDEITVLSASYPELREVNAAMRQSLADIDARLKAAGKPGENIVATVESVRELSGHDRLNHAAAATLLRQ